MTSTKKGKKEFTIQDFEKGLMLAGYLTPQNASEIEEKRILEEYDKKNSTLKQKTYFRRVVLAAEIVNELKNEPTFGRVKFQKLVYLCENASHIQLADDRYKKFAAGPFDNKFMHSINTEFKKQKWFDVETIEDNGFRKPKYSELDKVSKYKEYYDRYFSEQDEAIQKTISLLRNEKTRFVELIATIFYCWNEIIHENLEYSFDLLLERFYSWAEEKKRYTENEVSDGIEWMKKEKLTPEFV